MELEEQISREIVQNLTLLSYLQRNDACIMAHCTIHEKHLQVHIRQGGMHRHTPPRRRHHPASVPSGPFNDTGSQKDMVSPLTFPV